MIGDIGHGPTRKGQLGTADNVGYDSLSNQASKIEPGDKDCGSVFGRM